MNWLTREGLKDVRVNLDRARLLAEIRASNGLLGLTFGLLLLAAVQVGPQGLGLAAWLFRLAAHNAPGVLERLIHLVPHSA